MNWLDYFMLVIIGMSTVFAAMRGFLREVVSLLSWVVAFWIASRFSSEMEPLIGHYVEAPLVVTLGAFAALFIGVMVAMWAVGHLLKLVAGSVGLSWMDRLLGMLFGMARGILIVLIGFMIFLSFNLKSPMLVASSLLAPYAIDGAQQLGHLLPEGSALLQQVHTGYDTFQRTAPSMMETMDTMRRLAPSLGGAGSRAGKGPDPRALDALMEKLGGDK